MTSDGKATRDAIKRRAGSGAHATTAREAYEAGKRARVRTKRKR